MTPEPVSLKVSSPADILGYIPHSLGFQPRRSLVFITLSGSRVGATLRLDLPGPGPDSDPAGYAVRVRGFLEAVPSADGTLLAIYSPEPWLDPQSPPCQDLVCFLSLELAEAGLPLHEAWYVSDTHWRDYFCRDTRCCPWPGHPLDDIKSSLVNAELVFQGSSFAPSVEAAVPAEARPWSRRTEVRQAASAIAAELAGSWLEAPQFAQTLAVWDRCLGRAMDGRDDGGLRQAPETAGFLLASLHCRSIRDSLLVCAAAGAAAAVAGAAGCGLLAEPAGDLRLPAGCVPVDVLELLGDAEPERSAGCFQAILSGRADFRPDWERLNAAGVLFRELAAAADGESGAALLAMLAWIEWARARSSLAGQYLDRSLDACPGYNLALLLSGLLGAGILPAWSTDPQTAWRGGGSMAA